MGAVRVSASSWLHDDTEADLVGASWHQRAIRATSSSLERVAATRRLPWIVGDRLTLVATKPDGTSWRPRPDIMVYAQGGPAERAEMVVTADGLPALIIEVLSHSIWEYDVNAQNGKAWGYLQLGVPLYLVFDPHADLQGQPCRGWRQDAGRIEAWLPGHDGRYRVPSLGVALQPEDALLRVYDQDGEPVPFDLELALRQHAMDEQQRLVGEQARQIDALLQLAESQQRLIEEQAQRIAALEAALARMQQQE